MAILPDQKSDWIDTNLNLSESPILFRLTRFFDPTTFAEVLERKMAIFFKNIKKYYAGSMCYPATLAHRHPNPIFHRDKSCNKTVRDR
jgi:hypothetical protein